MPNVYVSFFARRSPPAIILISVVAAIAIGSIDLFTGYDLSLGLLYVAPISLVAWYISRLAGLIGSLFCAIIWLVANYLTAPQDLSRAILIWNTAIRLGFFVIITVLLASLREAYIRERRAARTDSLTGVSNSRAFREAAKLEIMRAKRIGYPLTLLYLDLDNFKMINDTYGHNVGDALLVRIGHALKASLRETDLVGRLGGDEFTVLLPDTDEQRASVVVAKIRDAICLETKAVHEAVSVSIGSATVNQLSDTIADLIKIADSRMYQLKRESKGQEHAARTTDVA